MAESLPEEYSEPENRLKFIAPALFFGGLFVLALGAGLFFFKNQNSSTDDIQIIANTENAEKTGNTEVVVHVDGAVVKAGVYKVPQGSRVTDVISAAGGLTGEADQSKINLAAKVADGQKIYIQRVGESASQQVSESVSQLVSINSASQLELESLPGIGPVTAQKIIASRPYGVLEDLLSKKVVSKSVFSKIKDLISL